MPEYIAIIRRYSVRCCRVNCESVKRSTEAANSSCSRSFLLSRYAHYTLIAFNVINQSINQFIILLTTSAGLRWVLLTLQHQAHSRNDCETVGIPPLMSSKTLGILDGGRGGGVDRSWRRRGIKGVDKGGA